MRNVIILLTLLLGIIMISSSPIETKPIYNTDFITEVAYPEDYSITILHLNAKWNNHNDLDVDRLKGCNIEWALMEDQPKEVQEKFNKIPVIALKKDGKPVMLWEGNIMFEPTVTLEEIQKEIDLLK